MRRFPQGGIFLTVHLAITPAALARLPAPPSLPLALISHAIDGSGCLARAGKPPRGALLGLTDRCAAPLSRPDALCHAVVSECLAHGCRGVLADFEGSAPADRLPFLSALSRRLAARSLRLYAPLTLPAEGAVLLVGTAVSGGSLRALLEEASTRYGAQRLALDLERLAMDFPLPCPSGCGTPLTQPALASLQAAHPASVYYSRELMANYFTYADGSRAHFVLFDDAATLRGKLALAGRLGISEAFVMYPEVADLLPELERQ